MWFQQSRLSNFIEIALQHSNFIEITLWHRCSPVNLLHIFRTPFTKNTSGRLLLIITNLTIRTNKLNFFRTGKNVDSRFSSVRVHQFTCITFRILKGTCRYALTIKVGKFWKRFNIFLTETLIHHFLLYFLLHSIIIKTLTTD